MIEGLRLLPQILHIREKQKREFDDGSADEWLDCTACKANNSERTRMSWGCGYIADHGEPRDLPLSLGELDECPGRLIKLPVVQEVTRAAYWAETGQLALYYENADIPRNLFEYIEVFESSKRQAEADALREAGKGGERGH